jgi:hypothetical protein
MKLEKLIHNRIEIRWRIGNIPGPAPVLISSNVPLPASIAGSRIRWARRATQSVTATVVSAGVPGIRLTGCRRVGERWIGTGGS